MRIKVKREQDMFSLWEIIAREMQSLLFLALIMRAILLRSIPKVGGIVQTITVGSGKTVLKCVIGLAIVLQVLAAVLNRKYEDDDSEETSDAERKE